MKCVWPGIQYFQQKFENDSEKTLAIFKAAQLFSPIRIHEIQSTASDLESFPFCKLSNLKAELASYLAKASQLNSDNSNFDILKWLSMHAGELPH